jgi:molecular chaperone DnaK (HSP70)
MAFDQIVGIDLGTTNSLVAYMQRRALASFRARMG